MNRAPTKSTLLRRRWIAARGRFAGWRLRGFRIEEARTGTENLTVRPVLFAKENLAVARIAVEPAGDESEMFAEFLASGGWGWRRGLLGGLHRCYDRHFRALHRCAVAFE